MQVKVVELFAGVGGFRLGLNKSSDDFQFVWANQWEPGRKSQYAFECYVGHFGQSLNHVNDDIGKVKGFVPDHDLLVGGFPCQDYSVASTGAKGIEGKKGVLWWEIRDIIANRFPKFILLENVDRLLKSPTSQRGRDFGIILRTLGDLGYIVEWRVINAAEYGNAQRRRRVFIFATRRLESYGNALTKEEFDLVNAQELLYSAGFFSSTFPVKNQFSTILRSSMKAYANLIDISDNFTLKFGNSGVYINDTIYTTNVQAEVEKPTTLSEITTRESVSEDYFITANIEKWEYLKGSKKIKRIGPVGNEYFFSEGSIAFPDPLNKPARTMLTSESTLNRSTHIIEDYQTRKLRKLTEEECEKLNGFDSNWTKDYMPQRYRYFVMGNALVVPLVTRMGNTILKFNSNLKK